METLTIVCAGFTLFIYSLPKSFYAIRQWSHFRMYQHESQLPFASDICEQCSERIQRSTRPYSPREQCQFTIISLQYHPIWSRRQIWAVSPEYIDCRLRICGGLYITVEANSGNGHNCASDCLGCSNHRYIRLKTRGGNQYHQCRGSQ